jgi:uridine nucleosidase
VAEANFFHDPHAAQIVLSAGWKISLAGLDVCDYGMISEQLLDKVSNSINPLAKYIKGASPFFMQFLRSIGIQDKLDFPDALAAAYLLIPEKFKTIEIPLFVEVEGSCMGQSVPVPTGKWYENLQDTRQFGADRHIAPVNVMLEVDNQAFIELIRDLFKI